MEVFRFMLYHPLELVDPCFEDNYEGFISDFVENGSDCVFEALSVRDVIFGEFSRDMTKEDEVSWCEVRHGKAGAVSPGSFLYEDIPWIIRGLDRVISNTSPDQASHFHKVGDSEGHCTLPLPRTVKWLRSFSNTQSKMGGEALPKLKGIALPPTKLLSRSTSQSSRAS
jgi:hypothetical protein